MIAALYVQTNGCYYGLDGVDPWDVERDARKYRGPHAVVAHPPCERWGRYWSGGPSARVRRHKGDDNGCFAAALAANGVDLPELKWGSCGIKERLDEGFHSAEERRRAVRTGVCQRLSAKQRAATPIEFRDVLLGIARSAHRQQEAA